MNGLGAPAAGLRELALFAGAGGGLLASRLLGWRTVCAVELDAYCQRVLAQRQCDGMLDPFPIWDDVRTFGRTQLNDAVYAQNEAIQMAGKLKKLTEERISELIKEYESGLSIADCAHLGGVSRQALWGLFKHRGVTMRPQLRFGVENHFYRQGRRADAEAHDIVDAAIRNGSIINPGRCESCGSSRTFADGRSGIQAHHDDYNKPLSVRWLCQPCHHEWHRNHRPIPKEGGLEPVAIDVISGGFP